MLKSKGIPSQQYLQECFDYNKDTGVVTWKTRPPEHFPTRDVRGSSWLANLWNSQNAGNPVTCQRANQYLKATLNGRAYDLHRLIWKWVTGGSVPLIDHRNTVKTDNRWDNLRAASAAQSLWNIPVRRHNVAGLKGVKFEKRSGKFIARININGRDKHLGSFTTPEAARERYCEVAREYHGEFWNPG